MSKSQVPPEVKAYIDEYKMEDVIKDAVNTILSQKPADPYTTFSQYFGKLSTPVIELEDISGLEMLNNELKTSIQLIFTVQFKNQKLQYKSPLQFSQSYPEQEIFYDDEQKNMKQAIQEIEKVSHQLKGMKSKEQKEVDEILLKYLSEHPNRINVIQQISFSLLPLHAHFMNQRLTQLLRQQFNTQEIKTPKLFVNLLQGSKVVASKCKIYKFLLICEGEGALQKIQNVVNNVKKTIISGKKGEAGLQFYQDGTFICPGDTIPDNLKIIEQAIEAAQLKDHVQLGLVWLAELFYVPEEKKYDLDNPKKLLDADQLIDYYFKLCQEKPIIVYLEDPIHHTDIVGWTKITNKFKDSKVKLGSRRLYSNIDKAKKHCEILSQQTNPELSEQQITQMNNERIHLDYMYKPLYEYNTFTELYNHLSYLISKKSSLQIIIGDSLVDTEDSYFVDVAFSLPNSNINIGPPLKYEKIIKYNKFLKLCHESD
ncbi:unnamed protein product (macronuclear) [Paramecium tetraurelia]|uniref:phosphopyruvate hydratase n=1 Tax=Paramecium tetraurelia TaxID=5888 RepID=A0EAX2_PARTE|nr:uncharacterized protein GSPATT00025173001 [Paramecium tetraurelia]CAK92439.1 unnamed protein product [Paramecium tetraurelia]|eukprot:XP_001459836.1 hypothetical protein (macronuclear) [Paramecium tetraurelia strain d4-2]